MGCLIGLFVYPFRFLKWAVTNGWKGLIVLAVVVIILIIGFVTVKDALPIGADSKKPAATAKATPVTIPTIKEAPYQVTTISRVYYAREAKTKDKVTTMRDYYELINGKWIKQSYLELPESEFGKVIVGKRR